VILHPLDGVTMMEEAKDFRVGGLRLVGWQ
jgi:hypothetical protein